MAMGRVRFPPETLTNWTGAGVKLPETHTRTQHEMVMCPAVFVGLFQEPERFIFPFR